RVRVDARGSVSVIPRDLRRGEAPGLALRTVAIGRTDHARLPSSPDGIEVASDGSLAIVRGAVVERLEGGEQGLEQSWELARRPEGSGDLLVRVAAAGLRFARKTERGLHFVDLQSSSGVRY